MYVCVYFNRSMHAALNHLMRMHDAWSVCRIESNLLVKRFTQDLRIHDGMRMAAAARFQVCASRSTDCKCVWYSYVLVPPHIPFSTPYWCTCSRHATMLCARSSRVTAWRGRPSRFLTIHKEHAVKQTLSVSKHAGAFPAHKSSPALRLPHATLAKCILPSAFGPFWYSHCL